MLLSSLFICLFFGVSSGARFICPRPNGFFADESSSNMFYHCINSIPYRKPCPFGLAWSQKHQRCIYIPPTIIEISNACSKINPCKNDGLCEPLGTNEYFCLCKGNYYGTQCEHEAENVDLTILEDIINGTTDTYESVIENVLSRNMWTQILAIVDVTGSMEGCIASMYNLIKSSREKSKMIHYYVFFNDGDEKFTVNKTIGSTGGIYDVAANNLNRVLSTMQTAMKNGYGGDIPENDIEAILHGIEACPSCKDIIHIADNKATPRDLALLNRIKKPVKILTCQIDSNGVNPQLLNIADRTNGTLHTLNDDITNLSEVKLGETILIGQYKYLRTSNGFIFV